MLENSYVFIERSRYETNIKQFQDLLAQKFFEAKSPDTHRKLIEFITDVSASADITSFPPQELCLLLRYLLQFQDVTDEEDKLAVKMRYWASIQLHNITRTPRSTTLKCPFIDRNDLSTVFKKVLSKIDQKFLQVAQKQDIVDLVMQIICEILKIFLKQMPSDEVVIEDCFKLFHTIQEINPQSDYIDEFLATTFQLFQDKQSSFDRHTVELFFKYHIVVLECEILNLLLNCCNEAQEYSHIKSTVQSSIIMPVCIQNPSSFKNILSILSSVWFNSEGHPAVGHVISAFVSVVESQCPDGNIVPFFPRHMQHLVLLFCIEPGCHCLARPSSDLWRRIMCVVSDKTCDKKEIILLFVIYPLWYSQLLNDVKTQDNEDAITLLKLLWCCNEKKYILEKVSHILNLPSSFMPNEDFK